MRIAGILLCLLLAGAALGGGIGYYEYTRESAWSMTVLPHGITVGFRKQF